MATKTRRKATEPQAATVRGPGPIESWLRDLFEGGSGGDEEAGVRVTSQSVLGLPAVWYSLSRICGHVGLLPLNLYLRQGDDDAEIDRNHPAYWLMRHQPNDVMTAAVFRETVQHHALIDGNGRAAIIRNGRGEPSELVILQPSLWSIVVQPAQQIGGAWVPSRKWHVRVDDPSVKVDDKDCLHILGLSRDGIAGIGLKDAARQAMGLACAQQLRAVKSEKNGARVKFLLSAPAGVFRDEDKAREFIEKFNEYHAGPENAEKAGLLREGITVQNVSQTNQEAQSIEGRQFSRQDIGLLFGVESMLGDASKESYASLEMKMQAYILNCLMRWLTRWEQECAAKLLTKAERNSESYYFRFVTQALLRGTTKERYDVYQIARQIGVLNANEVRELEDYNARKDPGGQSYDNPATTPGGAAATQPASKATAPANAAERLSRVVTARVQQIVNTEVSRVRNAAEKERNFCDWVGDFYQTWTNKVCDAVTGCDGDAVLAKDWADESERRLLAVAGSVTTQADLAKAIAVETSGWNERASQLASAIVAVGG